VQTLRQAFSVNDSGTFRKIAAFSFPLVFESALWIIAYVSHYHRIRRDQSLEGRFVLAISIIVSSVILNRTAESRFWNVFLFSCSAGFFPLFLLLIVAAITFDYGFGGVVFVIAIFGIQSTVAALCALPIVALIYQYRSARNSSAMQTSDG